MKKLTKLDKRGGGTCLKLNLSAFQLSPKKAFTLAEVLITLGIIGIVAAMTIPNLISHYQKESTATQLKKTFATVSLAVRTSESENEEVAGWDMSNKNTIEVFDKYLAPYMKCSKKLINAGEIKYFSPNGKQEKGLAIIRGGAGVYTLLSGVQLIVNNGVIVGNNNGYYSIGIMVDLNGYNTKPNKFGRDAFFISIAPEEGVKMSYRDDGEGIVQKTRKQLIDGPSNENYQCNYSGRGIWCGALIQRDGWKISDDYPWK